MATTPGADPVHDPTCVAIAVEGDTGLDVVVNRGGKDLRVAHQVHTAPCGGRRVVLSFTDLIDGDEICVGEHAERHPAWREDHDLDDIQIVEIEQTVRITIDPATGRLFAEVPAVTDPAPWICSRCGHFIVTDDPAPSHDCPAANVLAAFVAYEDSLQAETIRRRLPTIRR